MAKSGLLHLKKLEEKLNGVFTLTENVDIKEWMNRKTLQYEIQDGSVVKIKINGYQLNDIPTEVFEFKNLRQLSLSNNNISSIPKSIVKFSKLTDLILIGNNLSELPRSFGKLSNLKKLYLSFNQFKQIPYPLFNLDKLEQLHLSSNIIESIPSEIKLLTELETLWLSRNSITEIPIEISYLGKLIDLYLANNKIRMLPKFITSISTLKQIILSHNPIKQPPPEIIELSKSDIFEYLNQLPSDDSGIEFYESKLIIVGEGNVGKTCLAKKLSEDVFEKDEETTKGINISEWYINAPVQSKKIRLNIWDFGGQEIYYATHQFFLTSRSVYILVWNARRTRDYENINYWLHTISAYSNNSPILIVMTKLNERDDDLNMKDLKDQFPQIVGFLKVDNEDGTGIDQLKLKISKTAWSLPQMGDKWIDRWLSVRKTLETETKKWITYDEYIQICLKNNLTSDESKTLSEYLHNLGIILNFSDNLILRNHVIIQPKWATNAIYSVLDVKDIISNNGLLFHKQLDSIWDVNVYPKNVHAFILELMNKFELAYELSDKKSHLIPQLLSSTEPDHDWCFIHNTNFYYKYNFLPIGIIPRFIVRIHPDIEIVDDKHLCWREGLILRRNNARAFIKVKPFEKIIQISIVGEDIRELLAIIRYNFESIHNSISKITIQEQVPCNCEPDCTKLWDYKKLVKLEKKGIEELICDHEGNKVSIKNLLDGYEEEKVRFKNESENTVINIYTSVHANLTFNIELSNYRKELEGLKEIFKPDVDKELNEIVNDLCIDVDELAGNESNKSLLAKVKDKTFTLYNKLTSSRAENLLKNIGKGFDYIEKIERYVDMFKNLF